MQEEILSNINDPRQLETLYRRNRALFKAHFDTLYPQLMNNPLAEAWQQRLNYGATDPLWGTSDERLFVAVASVLAALLAKLPDLLSLDKAVYYPRNVGFIVFPILMSWFGWKNSVSVRTGAWLAGFVLLTAGFINALPLGSYSDTLTLSCIHLPLLLWSLLGFVFGGGRWKAGLNGLGFVRYNGELAVMLAVLLLAGGLTTALTLGLFQLIGWRIETVYFDYVVVCGLAALPIVGTFLTQTQPALVSRVAPVVASLFSPVALVMLVVYLVATIFSGRSPYQDREFLLLFNALLIGVMALIFFSIAGSSPTGKKSFQPLILFLLSVVTVVVNGIALSAILFRISAWGITPNRAAVLGANGLMLSHLLVISVSLLRVLTRKNDLDSVGRSLSFFLPIYGLWAAVVTFLFPLLFGFS